MTTKPACMRAAQSRAGLAFLFLVFIVVFVALAARPLDLVGALPLSTITSLRTLLQDQPAHQINQAKNLSAQPNLPLKELTQPAESPEDLLGHPTPWPGMSFAMAQGSRQGLQL